MDSYNVPLKGFRFPLIVFIKLNKTSTSRRLESVDNYIIGVLQVQIRNTGNLRGLFQGSF